MFSKAPTVWLAQKEGTLIPLEAMLLEHGINVWRQPLIRSVTEDSDFAKETLEKAIENSHDMVVISPQAWYSACELVPTLPDKVRSNKLRLSTSSASVARSLKDEGVPLYISPLEGVHDFERWSKHYFGSWPNGYVAPCSNISLLKSNSGRLKKNVNPIVTYYTFLIDSTEVEDAERSMEVRCILLTSPSCAQALYNWWLSMNDTLKNIPSLVCLSKDIKEHCIHLGFPFPYYSDLPNSGSIAKTILYALNDLKKP